MQQPLADSLRGFEQVEGFTFSHHSEEDPFLSVRVDVLLADGDAVIAALVEKNHLSGQGVYWVMPVEKQGRL